MNNLEKRATVIGSLVDFLPYFKSTLFVDRDDGIVFIYIVGEKAIEKTAENILKFTKESEKIEMVFAWGAEHTKKHTTKYYKVKGTFV